MYLSARSNEEDAWPNVSRVQLAQKGGDEFPLARSVAFCAWQFIVTARSAVASGRKCQYSPPVQIESQVPRRFRARVV